MKFLKGLLLSLLTAPVIVYSIYGTEGVHLPLFLATLSAVGIGFIDPEKGWLLAIVQAILLLVGVLVLTGMVTGRERSHPDIELQSLYGAVGLTFAGSFIGAYMKRALDS